MHRKKKVKVRWVRTETSRDLDAWEYREGDRVLIELERTRPSRYHGNGVSGLVTDMDSPASWSATLWNVDDNYEDHALAKGLSANDAKKAALALYLSPENMRKAANRVAAKIAPNGIGGAA